MQPSDYIAIVSGALSLVAIVVSGLVARSQNALTRREQLFPFVTEVLDDFHKAGFKHLLAYVREDLAAIALSPKTAPEHSIRRTGTNCGR